MKLLFSLALVCVPECAVFAQEVHLTRTSGAWTNPQISPDGQTIFALRTPETGSARRGRIFSFPIDDRQNIQPLTPTTSDYREYALSPDGRIIAGIRLDEITGKYQIYLIPRAGNEERPLTQSSYDHFFLAWSANNAKLAACAIEDRNGLRVSQLAVVDTRTAREEILTSGAVNYWMPKWFGTSKIAVSADELPGFILQQIFVIDLSVPERTITQITFDPFFHTNPEWFPDGSALAYVKSLDAHEQIWRVASDGSGNEIPLTSSPLQHDEPRISPRGDYVAYRAQIGGDQRFSFPDQIFMTRVEGSGDEILLTSLTNAYDRGDIGWTPASDAILFSAKIADPFVRDAPRIRAVATGLGCETGRVNAGNSPIALRILTVNGESGGPRQTVTVHEGAITISIAPPPQGPVPAPFVLYAVPVARKQIAPQPDEIGVMCFRTPLTGGAPFTLFNTFGRETMLGRPRFTANAAPFTFTRQLRTTRPRMIILQGIIRDAGARSPRLASVTNAIFIDIR